MRRFKKLARWVLWVAAGFLLLLVALNFTLPLVVNTRPVKAEVAARLNHAIGGQSRFGGIELHILPLPGVILTKVHYDLAGRLNLQAATIAIYPKIATLLLGRLNIDRVRIQSPVATVQLPAHSASPPSGRPKLLNRSEVTSILSRIPDGIRIRLFKGQITFIRAGREAAHIGALALRAGKNHRLHADVEGQSDWADRFHFKGEINPGTLDGFGRLDISGARIAKWLSALRPGSEDLTARAAVDLHLTVQIRRLQNIAITFNSTAPAVTLAHGRASVHARHLLVQGTANITPQRLHAEVSELKLARPRVHMNASLTWLRQTDQTTAPLQLSLHAHDSDFTAVRRSVLQLAGNKAEDIGLLRVVRGGNLVSMTLTGSGASLPALDRIQNMHISGKAADALIFVPGVDLNLTEVSGDWQYADGILSAQHAAAHWGETTAQNGNLKLGLRKDNEFVKLDVDLAADLAQLKPFLKKVIRQPAAQAELARFESIQGSAGGHLSLSGPFQDLAFTALASDFSFTTDYNRLPYPLQVQGRGLTFTREGLALKEGHVRMGQSVINGLSGQVRWKGAAHIAVHTVAALIDWTQLYPWLVREGRIRERFDRINEVGGRLKLTDSRLEGPLAEVRKWHYATSGVPIDLTIGSPELPSRMTITHGTFKVLPERISFSDIRLAMLDSRVEAQGTIDGYRTSRPQATLRGRGVVGEQVAMWLQHKLDVPKALVVRSPVDIRNTEISWQRKAEARIKGTFNFPGDLKLGCALAFGPDGLDLQHLTLKDALSDVRMALRCDASRDLWSLSYNGHLQSETLDKLLKNNIVYAQQIEGHFSAHVQVDHPEDFRLQGRLEGRNLILPDLPWGNLIVRRLDLDAHQKVLQIRRMAFTLGEQRASISGRADFSEGGIALKAALEADTLNLDALVQKIKTSAGQDSSAGKPSAGLPKWTARIDVAVRQLNYANFALHHLQGVAELKSGQADMQVQQADMCGITIQGDVHYAHREISLVLEPQASGQTIQFAFGCLERAGSTERIEGTYNIHGRLTSRGTTVDALIRHLKGAVHLTAVNGRVFNLGTVGFFSNLLSYLQINNLVTGNLPNLSQRGFAYKRIQSEFELGDGRSELKEFRLISGGLNMVAGGDINLLNRQMNLTVLVSPLTTLDAVIRHIPILGRILQGTLVAIPVGVYGPLNNPKIRPLSPEAVGSRLLGIMERTLQTPFKLIEPVLPKSRQDGRKQGGQ